MRKVLIILGILAFSSQVSARLCSNIEVPVCWVDGKTYTNYCHLNTYGVALKHEGTCIKIESKIEKNDEKTDKNSEKSEQKPSKSDEKVKKNEQKNNLEEKLAIFLEQKFKKLWYSEEEQKLKFVQKLIKALENYKTSQIDKKNEIIRLLSEYEKTLESKIVSEENTGTDTKNEKFNWYTAKSEDKLSLFIRYIRDNEWGRVFNDWQRVSSISIVAKEKDWIITKNYVIFLVEEYYREKTWELGVWAKNEGVVIVLTEDDWTSIWIIESFEPKWGNLYEEEAKKYFPEKFMNLLHKDSDFYKETIKELQEINKNAAKEHFDKKK